MKENVNAWESLVRAASAPPTERDLWVIAWGMPQVGWLIGAARRLADDLGAYVHVIIDEEGPRQAVACGGDIVYTLPVPVSSDSAVDTLATLFQEKRPAVILFPNEPQAAEVAARLAEILHTGVVMGCRALRLEEVQQRVISTSPAYGGEYLLERGISTNPQIFTLEAEYFAAPEPDPWRSGEIIPLALSQSKKGRIQTLGKADFKAPSAPLRKAKRIVAVGRTGNNAETVTIARQIAEALGAQFAGDRSAFDSGFIAQDQIIGIIGNEVAPHIYLAIGIWGDILHNAGIQKARHVIAIHPDERAPLLKIAETAIVADPKDLLPKLLEALQEKKLA